MAIFIKLNKKNKEKLFGELKKRSGDTWDNIAKELLVSRSMLFNYVNGNYSIPGVLFTKIIKKTKIKIPFKKILKTVYLKKEIKIPQLNEELSEILGALNGDGYLGKKPYEICITGSKLENEYFSYLKRILEKSFNLNFKISYQENRIRIRSYSKELILFLNKQYNLPIGRKTGNLMIPFRLKKNKNFLRAYLRGLFDTDGSIYIRRKKEPVLEIISVDKNYLEEIKKALEYLGFKVGTSGKNLYIYNKTEIVKFFNEIKPNNRKHLKKYKIYFNVMRQ